MLTRSRFFNLLSILYCLLSVFILLSGKTLNTSLHWWRCGVSIPDLKAASLQRTCRHASEKNFPKRSEQVWVYSLTRPFDVSGDSFEDPEDWLDEYDQE